MRQLFFNKLLYRLLRSPRTNKAEVLEQLILAKEHDENAFYTLNGRPVTANDFSYPAKTSTNNQAIVMQGPLLLQDNFTFETLKLYSKLIYPKLIILSTWENEDASTLKQIENLGITVLLNKLPEYSGNQNINLQIVSTYSGLIKAKELGAPYALKTRTDQRIYSTISLQLFSNLLTTFPLTETGQKERLIITSLATIKYRLYGAGDMLMYGNIEDMLNYWSVETDERRLEFKEAREYTIKELSALRLGEMYLCSKYFEKLGYTLNWTLKQSWDLIGKYFCVIDHSAIDLYWSKYDIRTEFKYKYYATHSLQCLTFADWLSLYLNKVTNYPEPYLDELFGQKLI